jgi:siroheme synthase (precorrin-2 oxidase/ferrochelatase)|tara:strand:- start:813 stop:1112 length:300 start_codon:yes stop_codon:yes gene_type:complete
MKYKQQMIFETRDKIRQEHKKKMDKKRGKLKKQIKTVLQPKLDEIEKLPKTKQIKVYKRLITRIEEVQTKANKRQRILYELMNELMKEKLKNINTEQKK